MPRQEIAALLIAAASFTISCRVSCSSAACLMLVLCVGGRCSSLACADCFHKRVIAYAASAPAEHACDKRTHTSNNINELSYHRGSSVTLGMKVVQVVLRFAN
jgi:hypothetical protein